MSATSLRTRTPNTALARGSTFLLLACALLAGCDEGPVAPPVSPEPSAGRPKPGPSWVSITLSVPGQTSAMARDINDGHEVVGSVLFPEEGGAAFYWSESMGGTTPALLPTLPGRPAALASDVNESGAIAGAVGSTHHGSGLSDPVPVIWNETGAGWTLRPLEGLGHALGVNDREEAVGVRPVDGAPWLREALHWDAGGHVRVLPLPAEFPQAEARRINNDGVIAGSALKPGPTGGWLVFGVLWIPLGPGAWTPVVLEGGRIGGLTDLDSTGTLWAAGHDANAKGECCIALRWTVTIGDGGQVTSSRTVLGTDLFKYGTGEAINRNGDVAGTGTPGNNWAGTPIPVLYPFDGSTVKLPIPRHAGGAANAISFDRWMAGQVDGSAVVWHPAS